MAEVICHICHLYITNSTITYWQYFAKHRGHVVTLVLCESASLWLQVAFCLTVRQLNYCEIWSRLVTHWTAAVPWDRLQWRLKWAMTAKVRSSERSYSSPGTEHLLLDLNELRACNYECNTSKERPKQPQSISLMRLLKDRWAWAERKKAFRVEFKENKSLFSF